MATLGGILVVIAGIVIRVKTDTGTLTIECNNENIPVQIRQGTETVKELTLSAGLNEVILRSGTYEITVPVEYDSVTIENGTVEISRGSQSLVKVTQQDMSSVSSTARVESSPVTDEFKNQLPLLTGTPSNSSESARLVAEYKRLCKLYENLLNQEQDLRNSLVDQSRILGESHSKTQTAKKLLQ